MSHANQGAPGNNNKVWPVVLLVWLCIMGLTAGLVYSLKTFGPYLLRRDQSQASWHLVEEAWGIWGVRGTGPQARKAAAARAEALFREAAEQSPNNGRYRLNIARMLMEQDRLEEAFDEAERALPISKVDNPMLYSTLANLSVELKRWESAEKYARVGTEIDPKDPDNFQLLAQSLFEQGKPEEAVKVWTHRIENFPATPDQRALAAGYATRAGRFEAAVGWFQVPAEVGQLRADQWLLYAVAQAGNGDLDGAARSLSRFNQDSGRDTH